MGVYNETQRRNVIATAMAAVTARVNGATEVLLGQGQTKQNFDLDAGGMCNRFVRQCMECGIRLAAFTWPWRGATAQATLAALKRDGFAVPLSSRQPGDILGFNYTSGPGHIAIYLGREYDATKELIAENTSATRGYPRAPGTKVTRYSSVSSRINQCYRLFPKVADGGGA